MLAFIATLRLAVKSPAAHVKTLRLTMHEDRHGRLGLGCHDGVVDLLVPGSPAADVLQLGDRVLRWNGVEMHDAKTGSWKLLRDVIRPSDSHSVVVERRLVPGLRAAERDARGGGELRAPASSPPFAALLEDIHASGGFVGPIVDSVSSDGLRGLSVSRAVEAGAPLLALPPGSYLSAASDESADESEPPLDPPLKLFERLILRTLRARASGALPSYMATLPQSVDLLRDWSDDEPAQLDARLPEIAPD